MIKSIENLSKEELIKVIEKMQSNQEKAGNKIIELENKIRDNIGLINDLTLQLKIKEELVKYYELQKYAKHSHSLEDDNQSTLFSIMGEDEPDGVEIVDNNVITVEKHTRIGKAKNTPNIDYSSLRHEEVIHEADGDIFCELCGEKMRIYKYETVEELQYVPADIYVKVHKIPYYECKNCTNEDGGTFHSHPILWKPLISRSKTSPSLVAALIDYKFNLGLPYYAIEKRFLEDGIIVPRTNMTNWMINIMKYINPLYDMMHEDLLTKELILADETTTMVLNEEGKASNSTSYMWQYRTCNDKDLIVLYEYQPTRSGDVPAKTLKGFTGYLLSDKYSGYSKVAGVKRAFCHVHGLRYVRDAYELLSKKTRNKSLEYQAVKKYKKVFKIDDKIHEKAKYKYPESIELQNKYIQEHRTETLKEFEEFLVWLKSIKGEVVMKPKFTKSINYLLNDEEGFKAFMKDPRIPLGNNSTEAGFKPFILSRNRCKFYVSTRGADAAAKIYSLMITAKENGYNVYAYFEYLFDKIRYEDLNDKDALRKYLPYTKELPDYCKTRTAKEIKSKIKMLEDSLEEPN